VRTILCAAIKILLKRIEEGYSDYLVAGPRRPEKVRVAAQ